MKAVAGIVDARHRSGRPHTQTHMHTRPTCTAAKVDKVKISH